MPQKISELLLLTLFAGDGKIYSWGKGTFGQLGHGNFNKSYSPTLIDILSDKVVVDIAAGGTFSAAVTGTFCHVKYR